MEPRLYFSEYYGVSPKKLAKYGAFDISLASDLPLFIDPFLLFNSKKRKYQTLHNDIITYLMFLREKSSKSLDEGTIDLLFRFKEVKQNWLGFTFLGNEGHALGHKFARSLNRSLSTILQDFGSSSVTRGSHLEKLSLIQPGVGKDSISDFTANLIKGYLASFTEKFAKEHLDPSKCDTFSVSRANFNYKTQSWETRQYYLPKFRNDFVLLTPIDILTRDDTWMNYPDMLASFATLPDSLPNHELRSQVNQYFNSMLNRKSTSKDRRQAAETTILKFPELIDHYIRSKEDDGERAVGVSAEKVADTHTALVAQVKLLVSALEEEGFYDQTWNSYREVRNRVMAFKSFVEDKGGHRLFNRGDGKAFSDESELQLAFALIWYGSVFDMNREVNNGRGPVDFKVSKGSADSTLVEFKLATNTHLKRNLEKQVDIYKKANDTRNAMTVIVFYTEQQERRVQGLLKDLERSAGRNVVLIDARSDNKPSASVA